MGKVINQLDVKPEGADVDLDEIEKEIEETLPQKAKIVTKEREKIAFGLQKIIINIEVPDAEGGTQGVEENIEEIESVNSVEVTGTTRV